MKSNTLSESRLEVRIPGLNTSVKIRHRGLGFNPWRSDLTLVDLSANGMALVSQTLKLEALQKVDFELHSGGRTTAGRAVVCYSGKNKNQQRYGFLFIDTDSDFDGFLTGESFSSVELKRLGEEMAEQFMRRRQTNHGQFFNVQNQRMVDAVSALANRLGQMGLIINTDSGSVQLPADALVVDKNGGMSLPIKASDSDEIIRTHISLVYDADSSNVSYRIGDGVAFNNIIDLLDHLCHCFEQIAQP